MGRERSHRATHAGAAPRSHVRPICEERQVLRPPNASTANSFNACAPAKPPKTASTGRSGESPNSDRPSAFSAPRCAAGIGRPTTRYFGTVPTVDRVCEEHALRERHSEPVREPEMGVGLRQRRGNAAQARGEHHRPGDVAAASEDDIRTTPGEDAIAGERCSHRPTDGPHEPEADPSREARDRERVELEAGLRNELRLDAVARPGERHRHSARAKHLCDCERGPDVPCRPSRRDHAPKL